MDKKGFTLIEVLAVVAILAILIIVVVPNVTGAFGKAKDKNFVSEAQAVYKAAKNQYVLDNANGDYGIVYQYGVNDYTGTDVRALDVNNRDDFAYVVKFNADGDIYYFKVFDSNFEIELGDLFDETSSVTLKDVNMSSIVYKDGRTNEYTNPGDNTTTPGDNTNSGGNTNPGENTTPGDNTNPGGSSNHGGATVIEDELHETTLCAAGYYANSEGNCIMCPSGTYSSSGSTSCTYCPTGMTSPAGSTSRSDCKSGDVITPVIPPSASE